MEARTQKQLVDICTSRLSLPPPPLCSPSSSFLSRGRGTLGRDHCFRPRQTSLFASAPLMPTNERDYNGPARFTRSTLPVYNGVKVLMRSRRSIQITPGSCLSARPHLFCKSFNRCRFYLCYLQLRNVTA